ncbi:thiol reductant ABC exporter subunit CydC [Arsenicicoccus dermatophilus]|uniref:thiol reductant ABC exporter subunit CydC n=1 Tax=Arsenicicoccus dermatophilus TaxID=1076331 RepID=UPI003916D23C
MLGGLSTASGIALTTTSGWLVVAASHRPQILTLMAAIVAVRAFGMARPVLRYAERVRSHDAALGDLADQRVAAYAALVPLTPARLGRRSRSEVLTGAVDDLEDRVYAQVRVVVPVVGSALAGLLTILATALFSYVAAGIVAAVLVACALVAWLVLASERAAQRDWLAARAEVARVATLVTANAPELQAIGATAAAGSWLDRAHARLAAANARRARGRALGMALTAIACGAGTLAMAVYAHGLVAGGFGDAVAALLVLTPVAAADAFTSLPDAMGAWARAEASGDRLDALVDQDPPLGAHGTGEVGAVPGIPPRIALQDVSARWTPDRDAVGPVTTEIAPGEAVLVTGPNGSGKSTLLAVLAAHLDPASGRVLVDGASSRDLRVDSLRGQVALLDDEPHVFASTVRENLRLARPDADDDALRRALTRAGLGPWLDGLPDGLDTMLGSGHRGVSGGERARLALARAIVSERPVMLLDEPVAHLDHATATAVLDDLLVARAGRTVVMVSHREDGVAGFDRELRLG